MQRTAAISRRAIHLAVVAGSVLALAPVAATAADQPVTWTRSVNATVRGTTLQKTGGCDDCDDAGAVSRQTIRSGDGYVEFKVDDPYTFWMAGLTVAGTNPRFDQVDFGFQFNGDGSADVLENGIYRANSYTDAAAGDIFRIAVVRGRVQYLKNGDLVFQSRQMPGYPLVFATALGTMGARIADARIGTGTATVADQFGSSRTFANLDRNRDGSVSSTEWSGSHREFARLDRNNDGRLSRSEVSQMSQTSQGRFGGRDAIGTSGNQFTVDPRQEWTDTGVWVEAGDVISFDADGSIQMSSDTKDTASPAGSMRQAAQAPVRSVSAGTLIARIGDSAPIAVGNRRTVRTQASGQLFLGVNDDFMPDNSGQYRVTVTVQQR